MRDFFYKELSLFDFRCGRSILLQAILNKNKEAIHLILRKHAKLVEYFDNVSH